MYLLQKQEYPNKNTKKDFNAFQAAFASISNKVALISVFLCLIARIFHKEYLRYLSES